MVTATMIPYLIIVLLINNSNSESASSRSDDSDGAGSQPQQQQQPRKLPDGVEIITYSNLINDDATISSKVLNVRSDMHSLNGVATEYQHFNDASAVSTPKYETSNYDLAKFESPKYESLQHQDTKYDPPEYEQPKYGPPLPPLPPSIRIPSNYKIDESDLAHSYYTQFEPMPHMPDGPIFRTQPVHPILAPVHDDHPISHIGPNHLVKVIHPPIWEPEIHHLEHQYLETYRTIKSSVLSFYYKMQYVVYYLMNLFNLAGELHANDSFIFVNFSVISKLLEERKHANQSFWCLELLLLFASSFIRVREKRKPTMELRDNDCYVEIIPTKTPHWFVCCPIPNFVFLMEILIHVTVILVQSNLFSYALISTHFFTLLPFVYSHSSHMRCGNPYSMHSKL